MIRNENRIKKVVRCIVLVISIMFMTNIQRSYAKDGTYTVLLPDGTQVVYTWDNEQLVEIQFDKNDTMLIIGTHKTANKDSNLIYNTRGYSITKGKANYDVTGYTGKKGYIKRDQGLKVTSVGDDLVTTSTYHIDRERLMEVLVADLGYKTEDLMKGVTVYLSNIFQIGTRTNGIFTSSNNIFYYNYSNTSTGKGIVNAAPWQDPTPDMLKKYYDIEVHIKLNTVNKYDIVYVEEGKESNVLKEVVTNKNIIQNDTYGHTPLDNFKKDNKDYIYSGSYKVAYDNGKTTGKKNHALSQGKLEVTHEHNSNATLYFYYKEKEPDPYDIVVSYVNEQGTKIAKDNNLGKHKANASFSYSDVPASITYSKVNYVYTKKWSYKYINEKGVTVEKDNVTSPNTPYFKTLPLLKTGEKIYLTVYYEQEVFPYNIIASFVNSSGVEITKDKKLGTYYPDKTFTYDDMENSITDKKGNIYTYMGKWDYSYIDDKNKQIEKYDITSPKKPGFTKLPTVKKGYDLYLTLYYDKTDNPFQIIVTHVNEAGDKIRTDINLGSYSEGSYFSYTTIENPITYNRKNYSYNNKWKYRYTSTAGTSTEKSGATTQTTPLIKSLPSIKKGTILYVTLIYMEGDIVTPTPTPTPTPGTTPKPTTTPKPSSTPIPSPTPIIKPEIPEVEIPSPDEKEEDTNEVKANGIIYPDVRGNERFSAILGVPTNESLYTQVIGTEYMLGYRFVKRVGKEVYPISVKRNYVLQWQGALQEDGTYEIQEEVVEVEQICNIERAYGYWEIAWLDYYNIKNAVVNNYSLPNGSVTLTPNYGYYQMPVINYTTYSYQEHVRPPKQFTEGLKLPDMVLLGEREKPMIPEEDFTYDAFMLSDQITVKNDFLSYHGRVVMSDTPRQLDGGDISAYYMTPCTSETTQNALYRDNMVIDAVKLNGDYGSNGVLNYERKASVNSRFGSTITYPIENINNVVIHTPVYCKGIITSDNNSYLQLINPDMNKVHLVLDEDSKLNDMIVSISNTGMHSSKLGYFNRDYSKTLRDPNTSYIAESNNVLRNEVRFPFDVYLDVGKDYNQSNDTFVKANTWIVIGRTAPRVYLPLWVKEGSYTVHFRSIAVNGEDRVHLTEVYANENRNNYVAIDYMDVEVSGRLFGLTLYDVTDYLIWKEAFRVKNSTELKRNTSAARGTSSTRYYSEKIYDYTVGIKDNYGVQTSRNTKFTLPLVRGSHPKYTNMGVLKTGYGIRFMLTAIGSYDTSTSYIKIKPTFYHVDKDGKNRVAVDLYYDEEIYGVNRRLIRVGSEIDQGNIKNMQTGDAYLAIPTNELKTTASIWQQTMSNWMTQRLGMYSFSEIKLRSPFRTFVNTTYANTVKNSNQKNEIHSAGILESTMIKTKQNYYGEYYLPTNVKACNLGYDVYGHASKYGINYKETFWKKDGYIIVNFDIVAVDNQGRERLSYINANNYINHGHNSMWVTEGGNASKTDSKGIDFSFKAGDMVVYYVNKSINLDYNVGGTH